MRNALEPIGFVSTPFPEKFGVPRQPGLAPSAEATLELYPEYDRAGVFDGLEECSHIWLLFLFHQQTSQWSPKVRPPRLGGNKKHGVFATRSPRRPNPIGLSAVRLLEVAGNCLRLSGVDLVHGTPILDVKPYVPYSDCLEDAHYALTPEAPTRLAIRWSQEALKLLPKNSALKSLAEETLTLDPRPAYHRDDREYGTALQGYNLRWKVRDNTVEVLALEKL